MRSYKPIGVILTLVGLIVFSGCQTRNNTQQKVQTIPSKLSCDQNLFVADCVVTSFFQDKDTYLSTHVYQICPAAMSILMTSNEPQGRFSWLYANGNLNKSSEMKQAESYVPISKPVAQAVLTSILAGAQFIDPASGQPQDKQRIEGQWYTPIKLNDFTMYKNMSDMIDMVSVQDENGVTYFAKTYNYLWYVSTNKTMPRKIDIYQSQDDSAPRQILEIKILNYRKP